MNYNYKRPGISSSSISMAVIKAVRPPVEFMYQPPQAERARNDLHPVNIQLGDDIRAYGRKNDRIPQIKEMSLVKRRTLADVMCKHLGAYYGKTHVDFLVDIGNRHVIITPFFVAYGRMDWPTGAVFPIRKNHLPAGAAEAGSEEYWATEDPNGKYLVFRKLVSDTGWTSGLGKALITGGIIPFAGALFRNGEIEGVFSYVFPSNYGPFKEISFYKYLRQEGDKNYSLHRDIGARLGRIFPDACNHVEQTGGVLFEMDYAPLLARNPK